MSKMISSMQKVDQQPAEDMIYNHRSRRAYSRKLLRSQKSFVVDHLDQRRITNELKKNNLKERYNFKNWIDRVQRSQEYGREIHKIKQEEMYQDLIREAEERDAVWIQEMSAVYGEAEAKKMRELYWEKIDKRQKKKLSV